MTDDSDEALRRDAARYRILRGHTLPWDLRVDAWNGKFWVPVEGELLDTLVDEALAESEHFNTTTKE